MPRYQEKLTKKQKKIVDKQAKEIVTRSRDKPSKENNDEIPKMEPKQDQSTQSIPRLKSSSKFATKQEYVDQQLILDNNKNKAQLHCDTCDCYFSQLAAMKTHMLSSKHNFKEKPRYYCETCELAFTSFNGLQKHYISIKHTLKKRILNDLAF